METDNIDDIKSKIESLKQASYKIAEQLYKQNSAGPEQSTAANTGKADDVEYEVHDEKSA